MQADLRRATSDDLRAVEEIVRAAYSHYVARISRAPGPLLDDYRRLIADRRVHVVERDGALSGGDHGL